MKLSVKLHQPFGPYILETMLPKNMLDAINKKTEDICSDPKEMEKFCSSTGNIPNLLLRDFEVVYFTEEFLEQIGFRDFVEKLGNYFLENTDDNNLRYDDVKLSIIDGGKDRDPSFKHSDKLRYSDAWVNRYYAGDFTPIHDHGSDLAGLVFLEIPRSLEQEQYKNNDSAGDPYGEVSRNNGRVQFVYGGNNTFCSDNYTPEQEVGRLLLFPSWLGHLVYPMRTTEERRTLSFNLISSKEYYEREEMN